MADDYHNTNDESGDDLESSRAQARLQQQQILAFFRSRPHQRFAPHEVPMPSDVPLTSVRRAITNLTTQGDLVKTSERRMGTFGKMVYTWELADPFAAVRERLRRNR